MKTWDELIEKVVEIEHDEDIMKIVDEQVKEIKEKRKKESIPPAKEPIIDIEQEPKPETEEDIIKKATEECLDKLGYHTEKPDPSSNPKHSMIGLCHDIHPCA